MEQVEIVDKDLNILYITSKKEAHSKGLLHKTVIAEVINSKGEMLLVRQSVHKQDAGQYVSPVGGHESTGESDEQALIREAKEEIGIENFEYKHVGNLIYNRRTLGRRENHYFIIYEIKTDCQPTLNDESDEFQWFSKNELKLKLSKNKKMFGNAFFPIVEKFYSDLF
jgi:8-oxo-dGTP pyrophosphatase MutT (NUDIX family)